MVPAYLLCDLGQVAYVASLSLSFVIWKWSYYNLLCYRVVMRIKNKILSLVLHMQDVLNK